MIDGREIPDRVQWHEGMLLAPQHFQQADSRHEGLLHYHVRVAAPFHWGVRRLRIDPVPLTSGTFRVTELEAILPDGLLITDPSSQEEELRIELGPYAGERPRGALSVHLAVAAQLGAQEPAAGSLPRYHSVEGVAVADSNTYEDAIAMPRLRPRATLLVTDLPPEKYTSLPLAQVTFEEGTFTLSGFIPPMLEVGSRTGIGTACSRLLKRVRERATFLSEKIRSAGIAPADAKVSDMQLTLERLVGSLPTMEALLAAAPHPWPLYLGLCDMAGRLAGLAPGTLTPTFRPYDHNDLNATFTQVLNFCVRMVEGVQQAYEVTPFRLEEGAFRLTLKPEWVVRPLVVGVTTGPALQDPDVVPWVMESRIGSVTAMPSIRDRRIRGAARRPIERDDELSVFPTRGVHLFRIDIDPEFVRDGETLEISHPAQQTGRGSPAEVVLYAPAKR